MSFPPFRADHVGSLLRPEKLRRAHRDFAAGRLDEAGLILVQDQAIREAIRMQDRAGLPVVTDGEFRRGSYWGRFVERCGGLAVRPARFAFRDDHGHATDFTAPHVVGQVARTQPLALDEFLFLSCATKLTAKLTLPAPSTFHFWRGSQYAEAGTYADPEAFFADLAAIYRAEITDLQAAGCRYLQLDEVALAQLCDPDIRDRVRADGLDPGALVGLYVRAIEAAIEGRSDDLVVGLHLCRGNHKGHYLASGGYDEVAERLFAIRGVHHFLLEYDTPRAGDFAPLRFLPRDKGAVLGLVSSKSPALETLDELRRRIDAAARHAPLERLGLSPQCGFASSAGGNPLTEADQKAKLVLVVETARAVWGSVRG
ncbi:MAG: 5-methyltetrahydropteroyltriglutamate--homocysteine S-methyltransferase [Alphaproteobacteria bacterium]|nr:5-methyltetrahydropteroyltriglutamate--homocysteine S-methyltransferase [Alphaproteobacteria bacterium]